MKDISPIINGATRKEIEEHAEKVGVHYTTLYRWHKGYTSIGSPVGVLGNKRGRKKGTLFIEEDIEKIIHDVIENEYLTPERPSIKFVINKIKIQCVEKNLSFPSNNTIRNRIKQLSQYEILKKQGNKAKANDVYGVAPKKYQASYPLQIVQIDHTRVDLMIVDDEYRKAIDRPWITLAIDIYSRMIVGYYLSLDAPSGTSVGMCILNSILQKNKLLADFDINSEWNIWGKMNHIDTDNGADFRSFSVEKSCLANGIHINFRPIGKKEYGGHIERLIGTTMKEVHDIPGTTFSNINERLKYDSKGRACMTFSDFEKWLLLYITKIYQHNIHSSLQTSPCQKLREGIFGTKNSAVTGYPQIANDQLSLTIDFLPTIERTIQKNGVTIDGLNYFDVVLRSKVKGLERMQSIRNYKKSDDKYIFKRDPRDISYIWFYDDIIQEYFLISLANTQIPKMSLFELNEIKKNTKLTKNEVLNESLIIDGYKELYNHVDDSLNKSKKQRKVMQKIKNNKLKSSFNSLKLTEQKEKNSVLENKDDNLWNEDIRDFD
jgi:putative transposase